MFSDKFLDHERDESELPENDEEHKMLEADSENEENAAAVVENGRLVGNGHLHDIPPCDPVPLFLEKFNKIKSKVSPTEKELRALSMANLNDEFKHMEGFG